MLIADKALIELMKHLSEAYPEEGCGFFFGSTSDDVRTVVEILPVPNAQDGDKRRRFLIDPLDYIRAEKYSLESGLELLGVYHSHPNHPAIPSEHDLKQAIQNFSYIIVSVIEGNPDDITCWRLTENGSFEAEFIQANPIIPQTQTLNSKRWFMNGRSILTHH